MHFQKTNRGAYLNYLRAQFETLTGEVLVQYDKGKALESKIIR